MCSTSSKGLIAAFLAFASLGGCLSMTAPEGFLVIEDSSSEIKAVASDASMLWVRSFDDDHDGNLAYLSEALLNDFLENRGYVLEERRPIRTGGEDALEGEEMLFRCSLDGGPAQRYLLSLFTREGKICTVEYVGRGEAFNEHLEAVREAIGTLDF